MPDPKPETGEATGAVPALVRAPRGTPPGGSPVSPGGESLPVNASGGSDLETLAEKLNPESRV